MKDAGKLGYDSPLIDPASDDLNRWRLAKDIVQVIRATPPDWSTRIGVLGTWGEGKTTVVRFVESILTGNEDVLFRLEPWSIQSWDELWGEFGDSFSTAIQEAGLPFDHSWQSSVRKAGAWLNEKGAAEATGAIAGLLGKEKVAQSAFGLVSRWLRRDGEQIRAMRSSLGYRRVVVVIDDLDRCTPDLLPKLLLSLRELLDLPGFIFILAFDEEIVAKALAANNPAWGDGGTFLEKILDFRFRLPPVTATQKSRLIRRAIETYAPFVSPEASISLQELLPSNPRRLNALIRALRVLEPEVSRHDSGELIWEEILLAQLVQQESSRFFEALLDGDTLENTVGFAYSIRQAFQSSDRFGSTNPEQTDPITALLESAGVENGATRDQLKKLVVAMRARPGHTLRYFCEIARRPHAITWAEYRTLLGDWRANPSPGPIENWVSRHAEARAEDVSVIFEEVFAAAIMRRQQRLADIADCLTEEEQVPLAQESKELLDFFIDLFSISGALSIAKIWNAIEHCLQWAGWDRNPVDVELRGVEASFITRVLGFIRTNQQALALIEEMKPWERRFPNIIEDPAARLKHEALGSVIIESIGPQAVDALIALVSD